MENFVIACVNAGRDEKRKMHKSQKVSLKFRCLQRELDFQQVFSADFLSLRETKKEFFGWRSWNEWQKVITEGSQKFHGWGKWERKMIMATEDFSLKFVVVSIMKKRMKRRKKIRIVYYFPVAFRVFHSILIAESATRKRIELENRRVI